MKKFLILISIFILFIMAADIFSAEIKATTDDGRRVILNTDGTWRFAQNQPKTGSSINNTKPASAQTLAKGEKGTYGVWYDNSKWKLSSDHSNADTEFEFEHLDGDCYGMVIFERIQMSIETLKDAAISFMNEVASEVKIAEEEIKVVNDNEILYLKVDVNIEGTLITYFNYYYAGPAGTIQVITYTGTSLAYEYRPDAIDLLNGFVTF